MRLLGRSRRPGELTGLQMEGMPIGQSQPRAAVHGDEEEQKSSNKRKERN